MEYLAERMKALTDDLRAGYGTRRAAVAAVKDETAAARAAARAAVGLLRQERLAGVAARRADRAASVAARQREVAALRQGFQEAHQHVANDVRLAGKVWRSFRRPA